LCEDCLLFLYVLCYDNKNEAAGFLGVIAAGDLPAQYTSVENVATSKMLIFAGAAKEVSREQIYCQLGVLARRYGARKLVLFGSRARGDFRERSDIDLAVYGMPPENRTSFWLDAEDLPTLLTLDIVHVWSLI
jgi:predicted nucleotidyltransferase